MGHTLLLSLGGGDVVRTFAFDEMVQSVLWIGRTELSSPHDALVCVERRGDSLLIRSASSDVALTLVGDTTPLGSVIIERGATTMLGLVTKGSERVMSLYIRPVTRGMARFERFSSPPVGTLVIGRDRSCELPYENRYVCARQARLTHTGEGFVVEDLGSRGATLVNGHVLAPLHPRELEVGDIVTILDFTLMVGHDMVCANMPSGMRLDALRGHGPGGQVSDRRVVHPRVAPVDSTLVPFFAAPRLLQSAPAVSLSVDAPPMRAETPGQPAIVQLGPSMLMGMGSAFMMFNVVLGVMRGADPLSVVPLAGMSATMVVGSVLWPVIARSYERRRREASELRRNHLYVSYLDGVECLLEEEARTQRMVRHNNTPPVSRSLLMARERSPLLMSHAGTQADFLHVRVGVGDLPLDADLSWPQRKPSTHADDMWDRLQELADNPPTLTNVPIRMDLVRHPAVGIVGPRPLAWEVMRGIMVQLLACYSYREVKVALVVDEGERREWEWATSLAHLHDATDALRLVATGQDGMRRIDRRIEQVLRRPDDPAGGERGRTHPHYVVVCASLGLAKRSETLRRAAEASGAEGVSMLYLAGDLVALPRSCAYIVDLHGDRAHALAATDGGDASHAERGACMFSREDMQGTVVSFDPDALVTRDQAASFALALSKVRLEDVDECAAAARETGFVALFEAGNVLHLNVGKRWREHDASRTLRAPLGVDEHGTRLCLDLHEDGQGPHGLIAGTTGSGKSELIITLILSLCVNYAPDEVTFLIIDYKGGGLAGAFCEGEHRLPHLSGTITNLDGAAIRRTLVSLRSELKRRQRILNEARARTGEATMDIRRYVSLYRQGTLAEPLPHLVVIADEFAELRQQEPEFMEELMTAARIGRSLGVHLVLATQKPSGVVSDQIWSNARFKLCLKVADAADSREMVRRDVAATFDRPGQFCLLVGYDEEFYVGQCAYAGGPYVPHEAYAPRRDASVELLDGEGVAIAREEVSECAVSATTELDAVIGQLSEVAGLLGMRAHSLWIDPLPASLALDEVDHRCAGGAGGDMPCIIGLVDDPWNQRYVRLDVDLAVAGNVLLYGMPGSGVERLLCSAVASVVRACGGGRLWVYGIDLGQGELGRLARLPQWGGMVRAGESERMESLLGLMEGMLADRRERAVGGEGAGEARVVVALSNLAAWMDQFATLGERLEALVREGARFGMHVLASTASVLGTSMRLRSSFGAEFATVLHDEGDYATLLGGLGGAILPKTPLRGLVRLSDHVHEFQGAHVTDNMLANLAVTCDIGSSPVPPPIPTMPQHVLPDVLAPHTSSSSVAVGLAKDGVRPCCVRVGPTHPLVVAGDDSEALQRFVAGLCDVLGRACAPVVVVDPFGELARMGERDVVGDLDAVGRLVTSVLDGADESVIVLANALRLVEALSANVADRLRSLVSQPAVGKGPSLVLAMEGWRAAAVYEPWVKAAVSMGSGVWVGNGFLTQTLFPLAQADPSYRSAMPATDGYVIERGTIRAARLVEPTYEEVPHVG